MKSPNALTNWAQFVTSVDGRADALDGAGPGFDLFDVDAGRQIVRHGRVSR
jgi:hypothetical protein